MTADLAARSDSRSLYVHDAGVWMSTPAGSTEWELVAPTIIEGLVAPHEPGDPLVLPEDTEVRRGGPTLFRVRDGRLTGWDHMASTPFDLTQIDLAVLDCALPTTAGELDSRLGGVVERLALLRSCGALDFDADPLPAPPEAPEPAAAAVPTTDGPASSTPDAQDEPVARWRMTLWPAVKLIRRTQRKWRQRRSAAAARGPGDAEGTGPRGD